MEELKILSNFQEKIIEQMWVIDNLLENIQLMSEERYQLKERIRHNGYSQLLIYRYYFDTKTNKRVCKELNLEQIKKLGNMIKNHELDKQNQDDIKLLLIKLSKLYITYKKINLRVYPTKRFVLQNAKSILEELKSNKSDIELLQKKYV